jgi:hypothetical protein
MPVMTAPASARGNAGDPLALTVRKGRPPVEARGHLAADPRTLAPPTREIAPVDVFGRNVLQRRHRFDAGRFEQAPALARNDRIRVLERKHDAFDAGRNQRAGTGSGPPGVRARLEADIDGRAGSVSAGRMQRFDFGVIPAGALGKALTDDTTVFNDDAADRRIRLGTRGTAASERNGASHVRLVGVVAHVSSSGRSDICVRRARLFGFVLRRLISSWNSVMS